MIDIDSFLDLVRKRRSIHEFKTDPFPEEYVGKIIEAARWSMSGSNCQPWEFIIVKDNDTRQKICDIYWEQRRSVRLIEMTRLPEMRQPWVESSGEEVPGLSDAPVYILVCGDPRRLQAGSIGPHFLFGQDHGRFLMSMACAIQNMQLAAAALGIRAQWATINYPAEEKLKPLLGLPAVFRIAVLVPLGHSTKEPSPGHRRPAEELVHFERYDQSKFKSDEEIIEWLIETKKGPGRR